MFGLGAVPGIAPAVATLTVPHTPRWLIEQGRSDDARAVLERTRSHRDIDAEVSEIEEVAEKQKQFTGLSISSSIAQAVLIGIVNLVFAGVAVLLLDRVGRRPPLIAGTLGSVLGLIVLGWYFSTAASFQHGHAWIALAAMLFYIACFEISLGPIFWVMIAEIFPLRSRAKAMAICTVFNWGFNFFVSFFFLDAVSGL